MSPYLSDLKIVAEAYAAAAGVELSTVSYRVFSDTKRLRRVFDGQADLKSGSIWAAMIWFSKNWPEGSVWPLGISRPNPFVEAAE